MAAPACRAVRGLATPRVAAVGCRAEMLQTFFFDVARDDFMLSQWVIGFYSMFSICDFLMLQHIILDIPKGKRKCCKHYFCMLPF
jgi:hypothetical protein